MAASKAPTSHTDKEMKAFGKALSAALAARGLTQNDLADTIGNTQSAVSSWTLGAAAPFAKVVFAAEAALRLPPGHLSEKLGYIPVKAEPPASVERSVLEDPLLDEHDRRVLITLYEQLVEGRARPRRRR